MKHLAMLIALDTRNPPGRELIVANYLNQVLSDLPGMERQVLPVGDGRANFVARLRAERPSKAPVMIMGHMDVVGVEEDRWKTRPFMATTVADGGVQYLHGRGAIDDKGMLAAAIVALEQLASRREDLDRDIVFLATAAEEGGPRIGIDEVVDTHFGLISDVEFAVNEGGRIRMVDGHIVSVSIQTTEKVPYSVIATATGPGGHASIPLPDNALAALARAVGRVHAWKAPVLLNETTRLYFAGLATIERDPEMKTAMMLLSEPDAAERTVNAAAAVVSRDPLHSAILRSGQALTILKAGIRSNVIPSTASATLNVRVIPGDDIVALVDAFNRVADEPRVTFTLNGAPRISPPVSPLDSTLYRAMEETALMMAPGAMVIPFMSTGATDGAVLRARGIPVYGILPMPLEEADELRMHGDDERVPLEALGWAAEFLYRTLGRITSR